MKTKTIYTEKHGPVVSYDDFDILLRSHTELLEAVAAAKQEIEAAYRLMEIDNPERGRGTNGVMTKIDSAINKAKNVMLYTAAPDMLEALEQVIRHGLIEQDGYETTVKLVWSAIEKAKGL